MIREELYAIQRGIARKAIREDGIDKRDIRTVAGADQSFIRDEIIISAVVSIELASLKPVERAHSVMPLTFPYIPGLLSFREAPSIIKAFRKLKNRPDVLMIDGCGINHPRGAGLATHVGVHLDMPTIGVSKRILCGECVPPEREMEASILRYNGRHVGFCLKSKKGCKPIIIAPGHKISLQTSLEVVRKCLRGYKLPEPTRIAHNYARELKNLFMDDEQRLNTSIEDPPRGNLL